LSGWDTATDEPVNDERRRDVIAVNRKVDSSNLEVVEEKVPKNRRAERPRPYFSVEMVVIWRA
jgi:hypothetical protein